MGNILTIGERLRDERERLGLNQEACAALVPVTRKTMSGYESGARAPDAVALAAWAKIGLDVQYVVTGRRQGQGLGESAIYQAVLDAVDLLSLRKKVDPDQLASAVTKLAARANVETDTRLSVSAPGGYAAGRDMFIGRKKDAKE